MLNENFSIRGRFPSYYLLTIEVPEAPIIIKAIVTAIGCMPGLDGKTLLLKTLHAMIIVEKEIKLGLSWKLFPPLTGISSA